MTLADKVKYTLNKKGFSCADAESKDDILGYIEHYYCAPVHSIYYLDRRIAMELSNSAFEIFKSLAGRFHEDEKDFMKGYFESEDNDLIFVQGKINYNEFTKSDYFEVPHLLIGGEWNAVKFWIHPSQEYINLFLQLMKKVNALYGENEEIFEYEPIKNGRKIRIPLSHVKEKQKMFTPLRECTQRTYGVPAELRHKILEMISEDINYIGGSYNWTTNWRGEDISFDKYNSFFGKHKKHKQIG